MIILVDMDGVLADFGGGFLSKWRGEYPDEIFVPLAERKQFYVFQDYPVELREKISDIYNRPGFFLNLDPVVGAIDALQEMIALGHDVRICTAPINSYKYCVPEKYQWVEKHLGFEFTKRIILAKDKTFIRGDILIDDRPEIKGSYKPQWRHVLFDAPYNAEVKDLTRITWSNWKEIIM